VLWLKIIVFQHDVYFTFHTMVNTLDEIMFYLRFSSTKLLQMELWTSKTEQNFTNIEEVVQWGNEHTLIKEISSKFWGMIGFNFYFFTYFRAHWGCWLENSLNLNGKSPKCFSKVLSLWVDSKEDVNTMHFSPLRYSRRETKYNGFRLALQICKRERLSNSARKLFLFLKEKLS